MAVHVQHAVEEAFADAVECGPCFSPAYGALSRCAHIMGVVVSEMISETRMAVDRVYGKLAEQAGRQCRPSAAAG